MACIQKLLSELPRAYSFWRVWKPVTDHLHALQTDAIRQVTKTRDLGLIGLLVLLCLWGDVTLAYGFTQGLPAVGYSAHCGIFPPQPAEFITREEVLGDWEHHNASMLHRLKPGKGDEFLLTQSLKDAEAGFCTQPLRRSELLRLVGDVPHRLIPRCVITQSSGKQCLIDDAFVGGQSATSHIANKIQLCSPLWPYGPRRILLLYRCRLPP